MCNLYSLARSRDEIKRLFRVGWDQTGNQPPLPAIYPDQLAPVVRKDPMAREDKDALIMETMRWGFPPTLGGRPVTNIRNTASPYWRGWLKREFRCLVPATAFCEYTDNQPKVPHWFALDAERRPFAFAGLWRPWTGTRKGEMGQHLLFAFLTTEANDVVRPVHAKAMPVILTGEECDAWLEAEVPTALALQRPPPAGRLSLMARGEREDGLGIADLAALQ